MYNSIMKKHLGTLSKIRNINFLVTRSFQVFIGAIVSIAIFRGFYHLATRISVKDENSAFFYILKLILPLVALGFVFALLHTTRSLLPTTVAYAVLFIFLVLAVMGDMSLTVWCASIFIALTGLSKIVETIIDKKMDKLLFSHIPRNIIA